MSDIYCSTLVKVICLAAAAAAAAASAAASVPPLDFVCKVGAELSDVVHFDGNFS